MTMLVIERTPGRRALIGDHSLVQVVSVDGPRVKLGFMTTDDVKRIDTPETVLEAARVEARLDRTQKKTRPTRPPVHVGIRTLDDGTLDIRASLREEVVDVAGYLKYSLTDETTLAPDTHEFLVLRVRREKDAETIKAMAREGLVNWRIYETVENDDATVSVLVVRSSRRAKGSGDVRYVTL